MKNTNLNKRFFDKLNFDISFVEFCLGKILISKIHGSIVCNYDNQNQELFIAQRIIDLSFIIVKRKLEIILLFNF